MRSVQRFDQYLRLRRGSWHPFSDTKANLFRRLVTSLAILPALAMAPRPAERKAHFPIDRRG